MQYILPRCGVRLWLVFFAFLLMRLKCPVFGRNALTSTLGKDIRPVYPVLEDNKEEECPRGCGASRTVAGKVMCGQKGIDSQEAEQLAGCLVVGEAPIFQEGF